MAHHYRRPRGRTEITEPIQEVADHYDGIELVDDPIDAQAIYDASVERVGKEWIDRYGEANWYAALCVMGIYTADLDGPLEDIPEELRWPGPSKLPRTRADLPTDGESS